jgi:hypothetical protein
MISTLTELGLVRVKVIRKGYEQTVPEVLDIEVRRQE